MKGTRALELNEAVARFIFFHGRRLNTFNEKNPEVVVVVVRN